MGPVVVDVGDNSGHEHDVDRPVAEYLIGDVDTRALGVLGNRVLSGMPPWQWSILAQPARRRSSPDQQGALGLSGRGTNRPKGPSDPGRFSSARPGIVDP
jgi:hypothetical protein